VQRFESLLLAPAIILGAPDEAGLNQKNSTSLTLGTQTAFDFHPPPDLTPRYSRRLYPPASAGLDGARKNLSNRLSNFVTYLWDTIPEVVSKSQISLKGKAQTDEKAQSRQRRYEQYILKRFATQLLGLRWVFETTSSDCQISFTVLEDFQKRPSV
jgi:hypothetical protein